MSEELGWLIRLRWYAAVGQALIVCAAAFALEHIRTLPLLLIVALVLTSNFVLSRFRTQAGSNTMGMVLLLDTFILTVLLYWSGGVTNPFSVIYVVHVALAAFLLGEIWTWAVALLSVLLYGSLFFFYVELPELSMHGQHQGFSLHLQGMWLAFLIISFVLAFFFTRLLKAIQVRDQKLKKAELLRLRHERIASITALAASAAHELNSPLGTIALAAEEIGHALSKVSCAEEIEEDAALIRSEVKRCAAILERLRASAGDPGSDLPEEISSQELLSAVKERIDLVDSDRITLSESSKDSVIKAPRRPLVEAMSALVRNALTASRQQTVLIECRRLSDKQEVKIIDTGLGMSEEVRMRLGEPFFSTRGPGSGLGLGVFLAKRFAEAMNGVLTFDSKEDVGTTACICLPLP